MTPEETNNLIDNIVAELATAADMVGVLSPGLIPLIAIGKAVAKQVPELASTVQRWIEGNPPTEAEISELKRKLGVLADPNLP